MLFIKGISNKALGKDGLNKEFYETFWNELKELFMNSLY